MNTPGTLLFVCWIVLLVYWLISSFNTKRYASRNLSAWLPRLLFVAVLLALLSMPSAEAALERLSVTFPEWVRWLGVIVTALGVSLAVWARAYLGRNWGMPMSLKQDAELVTTGPYAWIRHPIYSGFLLAMAGTTLVASYYLVVLVVFAGYFAWAAITEEKILLAEFPAAYSAYTARTWRLVPFLW